MRDLLSISLKQASRLFWVLLILTLATIVGMQITGEPLKTEAAPGGIVSFELIGNLEGSQKIMESWQGPIMIWAGINMGLDFLFLSLYGVTIALGCLLVSHRLPAQYAFLKRLGIWMAWAVIVAAGLDVVENISLIYLLTGSSNATLPVLAKWCAIPKFNLVLLSILYILGALVPALRKK